VDEIVQNEKKNVWYIKMNIEMWNSVWTIVKFLSDDFIVVWKRGYKNNSNVNFYTKNWKITFESIEQRF